MISIAKLVDRATFTRLGIFLAALLAYSFWAFSGDTAWSRALVAAGGALPEMQPGFPPIEPLRTLSALGESTSDYLIWQALDVPYIILNVLVTITAIGITLKKFDLAKTPYRLLVGLPIMYAATEAIENTLLFLFAAGYLAPTEPPVLLQQTATTLKLASFMAALFVGLVGMLAIFVSFLAKRIKAR